MHQDIVGNQDKLISMLHLPLYEIISHKENVSTIFKINQRTAEIITAMDHINLHPVSY